MAAHNKHNLHSSTKLDTDPQASMHQSPVSAISQTFRSDRAMVYQQHKQPDKAANQGLEKSQGRDADTWGVHLLDLQKQGYAPDVCIMDSAKGLVKGHENVIPNTKIRHDHFHIIRDLKDCCRFYKHKVASSLTECSTK